MHFLLACFPLLAAAPAGEVHVDERHGFRIEVPEGWVKSETDLPGGKGFKLALMPPDTQGTEGVTVTVVDLQEGQGVERLLEMVRASIEAGGEGYSEIEEFEERRLDRTLRGIRVDFESPAGSFHVVQSYLVEGRAGFVLQRHAPKREFKGKRRTYEAVLDTFGLVEPSAKGLAERHLQELVERCGSEVEWATTWDEAAARAERQGRLILVVTFMYSGFSLGSTPRTTTFMNADVIELVNERFVPFWLEKGDRNALTEGYGMSGTTFGQALMLATPSGEVLLETQQASNGEMAHAFLLEGLLRHPEQAGAPLPVALEGVDLAHELLARGEIARAAALLEELDSGRAHQLRARILRLERRGPEALAALAEARAAGGVDPAQLLVDEVELLVREERIEEAVAALDSVLEQHAEAAAVPEALLLRGYLDLVAGDKHAAQARWRGLIEAYPDSRYAWQAAAVLSSSLLDVEYTPDLGWPDEMAVAEILAYPESAPLPAARAEEAADGALAWLLAHQRPRGSWPTPSELSESMSAGPNPFVDAMTALAGRALIGRRREDGVRDALERALAYLQGSVARREQQPPIVLYMDYMTWSDACMLHFLADMVEARLAERSSLRSTADALIADLALRAQEGGGWSYYVTADLEGSGAPAQSISFTTACGVLALTRAREAGFEVPDELLEPAVSALQQMRSDEGVFAYFLYHGTNSAPAQTATPGAVGRGPACELALLDAGESDKKRLRAALDLFLDHTPLYAAEQGKVMMHAGPDGQGCHYLLFDYAHAALAQERLRPDARASALVTELVLACRQPDGSFIDTPILGRSFGTAMALLALDRL